MRIRKTLPLIIGVVSMVTPLVSAEPMKNPDFTKGEAIPEGANHDWNLGATGLRGWMFTDNFVTSSARQIYVTKVDKGTPADGKLEVGDVILGVAGKPFSYDPRTEFGKALTKSEAGNGDFLLQCWRAGKTKNIVLKLPVLGSYSATAPYNCKKSQLLLEQGCKVLVKNISDPGYDENPISRSLNALALLASGNPEYLPIVKREAEWAAGFSNDSFQTWYYGYTMMFLSEYIIATGDDSVMPGLRRLALEAARGQSAVGSWGHKFANEKGRLLGYGMMHSPGLPLTTALVLAQKAGVNDPEVATAIDRSAKLVRFYIGTGAIPYGDHDPWIQNHEDNGKCGMAAVLFNVLNEPKGAEYFSRMSTASHGPERDTGHTGNFFNMMWSVPGIAPSGPQATGAWMREFGSWYFDLARKADGSFTHLGPPQMNNDSYSNWDCTGAYLLACALPLKKIYLTGKVPAKIPQLNATAAKQLIIDGRGWNSRDRYSAYDSLSLEKLMARLSSWSPVVRERVAIAIARKKEPVPVNSIIALLDSPLLYARLGACQALIHLRDKSAPAIPALRKTLQADDLWLRIKAAEALAAIGEPAMAVVPELLQILLQHDKENDPRGMQQRYLTKSLFASRNGLLGRSLNGVERELLYNAVRASLQNQDGHARGSISSVYNNLSYEELKPLLPAIYQAILVPAPSGIMFADEIQTAGLELFSKYHVSEGIELLADYVKDQKPHASQIRITKILELLQNYGEHAQRAIPKLEVAIHYFENEEPDFPKVLSLQKAAAVRKAIEAIKASKDKPVLINLAD